jgi:hypothetical protein
METVCGTFMLACMYIGFSGHKLYQSLANRINIVLKVLGLDLELSRWTLAMDTVERAFGQIVGLKKVVWSMRRLLKGSPKLKQSRADGDKRGIDSWARNVRQFRRSSAKLRLELPEEIRVWNNIIHSVRSMLRPMPLYESLEIDVLECDLLVNESEHESYRMTYLPKL